MSAGESWMELRWVNSEKSERAVLRYQSASPATKTKEKEEKREGKGREGKELKS